jgi:hypothetical protein
MDISGAAEAGDLAEVQRLVGQDPRLLNARDHIERTPLMRASAEGHVEVVRWLVDRGAALDERTRFGWTALGLASSRGLTPVVRLLIEKGADLTLVDGRGRTAWMQASYVGRLDTVRLFLDHPSAAATLNDRDGSGSTALWLAGTGCVNVVRALLERGADPTTADNRGRTPLAIAKACKLRACVKVLKVVLASFSTPPLLIWGDRGVGSCPCLAWRQEAERAYLLWKARQVTDAAGSFAAPVMEARTRGETKRRRVEAVPEELKKRAAGGGEGLPGVSLVAAGEGEEAKDRAAVLAHAVQSLKPGVFEELMEMMG